MTPAHDDESAPWTATFTARAVPRCVALRFGFPRCSCDVVAETTRRMASPVLIACAWCCVPWGLCLFRVAVVSQGTTMNFDPSVSLGSLGAVAAVAVAAMSLGHTMRKDRLVRLRDQADKVRRAMGQAIALMDRSIKLSLAQLDELQPLMVDVDAQLQAGAAMIPVRDKFWRELTRIRAHIQSRRLDEQLEGMAGEICAYEPALHVIWKKCTERLLAIDRLAYEALLSTTQAIIVNEADPHSPPPAARTGNRLRDTVSQLGEAITRDSQAVLEVFQSAAMHVIQSTDASVAERRTGLSIPAQPWPDEPKPYEVGDINNLKALCVLPIRQMDTKSAFAKPVVLARACSIRKQRPDS